MHRPPRRERTRPRWALLHLVGARQAPGREPGRGWRERRRLAKQPVGEERNAQAHHVDGAPLGAGPPGQQLALLASGALPIILVIATLALRCAASSGPAFGLSWHPQRYLNRTSPEPETL